MPDNDGTFPSRSAGKPWMANGADETAAHQAAQGGDSHA